MITGEGRILVAKGGSIRGKAQTVPQGELQGLIQILAITVGPAEVAVDATYVLRGIKRMRRGEASRTNADLWHELGAVLQRRPGGLEILSFHHIGSHKTKGQLYDEQDSIYLRHYVANEIADAMASEAAEQNEIDAGVAKELFRLDERVGLVQRRLLEVAKLTWISATHKKADRQPVGVKATQRRHKELKEAKAKTAHLLDQTGNSCRRCLGRCESADDRLHWYRRPCGGGLAPPGVHKTHCFEIYKGMGFCSTCGCWSARRHLGLRTACQPASQAGRQNLRRIRLGIRPQGLPTWPDEDQAGEGELH